MDKLEQFLRDIGEFDNRLKKVERTVFPDTQPAQLERTPRLVEAVEEFLGTSHDQFTINLGKARLKKSLAAEKKRQELVGEILKSARSISQYDVHTNGICFPKLECEINALDAFEKGDV